MPYQATEIPQETLDALGVSTNHEVLTNGEMRFRLKAGDGSSYVRTVATQAGGWQNSHYHLRQLETYIVQAGWVALVELVDGEALWTGLRVDDVYTTRVGVAHNVFMSADAVTHTVKHGGGDSSDWHGSEELDSITKHLSETEVRRRAFAS